MGRIVSRLKFRQKLQTRAIQRVIECYGICEGMILRNLPGYVNDAFYFGLSKACRSLMASRLLYDKGFHEDSLVLIRTAYEAYLFAASSLRLDAQEVTDLLVRRPIMLSLGLLRKEKRTGRTDASGPRAAQFKPHIRPSFLVKEGGHPLDLAIHPRLYRHLCEHSHPNMVTSGHYRDTEAPTEFACTPSKSEYPRVLFLSIYVGSLLLAEVAAFEDLDPPETAAVTRQLIGAVVDIRAYLDSLPKDESDGLMSLMWRRSRQALRDLLKYKGAELSRRERDCIHRILSG